MIGRSVRLLGVIAFVAYSPVIVIYSLCIAGVGWTIAGVEMFVVIPMIALLIALAALPALAFQGSRPNALRAVIIGGGLFILFVPTLMLAGKLRIFGFQLAAKRAEPLVAAIGAYEKERGAPPSSLDEVVPRYLPALPKRIPELKLIVGDEAKSQYAGNRWVLVGLVSTGLINWDLFMYFPNQKYPDVGYGGAIERVADWAYVHE